MESLYGLDEIALQAKWNDFTGRI